MWGTSWARDVLPTVKSVTVTGYVDASPASLTAFREKCSVPAEQCFSSLRAALDAVDCDIVLAALRTDAHFAVVKEALEAGRHVVVEKPFTTTLDEARQLNELAARQNCLLAVSQNYRFSSAPGAVARLLAEDALGRVDSITLDFRRHAPTFGFLYYEIPDPLVADMSIHHFDMMRMLFGEIAAVSCRTWNPPDSPFRYDPACFATIAFASGRLLSYRASFMSSGADTPWGGEWTINCTKGEVVFSSRSHDQGQDDGLVATRLLRGTLETVSLEPLRYKDRAGVIAAFAEAVATGIVSEGLSLGSDNIRSLAVVKACVRSAGENGAWVQLSDILST
jgi:predicted dehydrogenase